VSGMDWVVSGLLLILIIGTLVVLRRRERTKE
jgi:LPXTG-motif cell wall-anchored protein